MLTAKYKHAVSRNIQDTLSAVETLRRIVKEATEEQDFITLSLITSDETLSEISNNAKYALDNVIPDCNTADEALKWWNWAAIEFPDITTFCEMSEDLAQEIHETAREEV